MYFSGQGKLLIGTRDATGKALAFRQVGNVPGLKITLSTSVTEHQDSQAGKRIIDYRLTKQEKVEVDFTLEEFSADNLALSLYGQKATVVGAAVVDEALPAGLVEGDYVRTKHPAISAVAVKDSAAAALVLGTDYEIESASHGTIKILDATSPQPWDISYTYAGYTNVQMFGATPAERWLRFEGLNTADGNKPVLVELYRAALDPIKGWDLINDDLAKFELSGSVLYDALNVSDPTLGGFGRIVLL